MGTETNETAAADPMIEGQASQEAEAAKSEPEQIGDIFEDKNQGRFGTFNGVFRPTILTILGVMMYLREGWVVGNSGLLGAILVILACYVITGTTALSLSSITTNIRVGSGGVFSIISQSLGLEVGGSVGIPLYLAQGLSAALYMSGIVETWLYIFPEHHGLLVTLGVFLVSILVAWFGAGLAFKVQVVVMVGTILALASMFLGFKVHPINPTPVLWGEFLDADFQVLFAVFFPAATGIMVGSSLSGSLKRPRESIPIGTMSAWGLSLFVYLSIAVWYALLGTPDELRQTGQIFAVEKAYWGPLVLLGVMASCFSATLSSLVASPRVLQALATYRIIPFASYFEKTHKNEPRNATLFTCCLVLVALLLGDLNTIAQILTIFFLVIYFMINLVLFIEQRLKMLSFRPMFPIQPLIPVVGTLSCLTAILIISPVMGLAAIAFVVGIYFFLDHKQLRTPWETVHSGIFAGIANWAAKKVIQTEVGETVAVKRSWKPDLLIPVVRGTQLEGYYRIVRALTWPQGSVQVAGFAATKRKELEDLVGEFQHEGMFATTSIIEDPDFSSGMRTCISIKAGSFFKPNTLFTSIENRTEQELQDLIDMAKVNKMGVIFLGLHPESGLGRERSVNLWVRDQTPDWRVGLKLANLDYSVLMSYQLKKNWPARVRVMSVVQEETHVAMAEAFIRQLMEYARMSRDIDVCVTQGKFLATLETAPRADLNIFGLSEKVDKKFLETMVSLSRGSCLFVLDSGCESALA